ncbi:hypothetical protein BJ742DRAFT_864913 [Cladochytrium replicatum]|nr:hypothetical protein BJ742DRAFT_864913 [Cladochytrium replicatum]
MEVLDTLSTSQEWMGQIPEKIADEPVATQPQQIRQELPLPQYQMSSTTGQRVIPRQARFGAANITVPKRWTRTSPVSRETAPTDPAVALPCTNRHYTSRSLDRGDCGLRFSSHQALWDGACNHTRNALASLIELLADDPEVHVDVTPTSPTGYTDASGNPRNSITTVSHAHYGIEASDSSNVAAQVLQQTLDRDSTVKRMLPPPPVGPPPPSKGTGSWRSGALSLQQQL